MKISTSHLWASDIVAYAADPINFDEVVKVNALASEIVAGSLLDKTTLTLANDATTAENLILVLDPAWLVKSICAFAATVWLLLYAVKTGCCIWCRYGNPV